MTQLDPFRRGYRQALRDMQRTLIQCGHTDYSMSHGKLAVYVAAQNIAWALSLLREGNYTSIKPDTGDLPLVPLSNRLQFTSGYRSGFDHSVEIIADWHSQMKDPVATKTLHDILQRLEQRRASAIAVDTGSVITLRKLNFAI